ncbi:hypothetical protein THAOC_36725 [Thalassiosira oceanica]|uniref:Uncharacterized protein n=1 Tax=Thalassiosira oceanica TaxID=159749 RepID=K0QZR7_THAOC|nr:hypothetical protein THAOC_36725 [Thalassiosira oceanica]|eukprot:EJK44715.1 hypothetical protein THAOC_36725 [Thalassiosira oceanica]
MRAASVIFAIYVFTPYETGALAFRGRCPKPMRVVPRSGREDRISTVTTALPRTTLLASNSGGDWVEKAIGGLRYDLVARVSAGSSFSPLTTSTDDAPSLPLESNDVNGWKSPELTVNDNVGGTQAGATSDQAARQRKSATSNLTALLSGTPDNRFKHDRSQY